MSTVDVLELVPYGHDNAITMHELEDQSGLSNRDIRKAISSSKDLIINLQDGYGYFRPLDDEGELVETWRAITHSRVKELTNREKQARTWLKK